MLAFEHKLVEEINDNIAAQQFKAFLFVSIALKRIPRGKLQERVPV